MSKNVKILINTSEITAGTRGASLGPAAVMTAAREKKDTFFSEHIPTIIPNENHMLDIPSPYQFGLRIDGLTKVFGHVMNGMDQVYKAGDFPFLLASDHGSAAATLAGVRNQYPGKKLGVVWIDAHGDLHTPYTTPSGNMHGMPLAIALDLDNKACQRNEVKGETKEMWDALKARGGDGPKFSVEDLFFIGVRDTEPEEEHLMAEHGIKNYTVAELRQRKWAALEVEFQSWIDELDILYISFDVDSMDPDITSHGTGTPVPDGITPDEARDMLHFFAKQEKLVCMEFVEVNPCLDEKVNRMAEVTFDLMKSTINTIKA